MSDITIYKPAFSIRKLILRITFLLIFIILPFLSSACKTTTSSVKDTSQLMPDLAASSPSTTDDLLIVDCLLPGKIKKMGPAFIYLTPRRAIKATALECQIRGGECVSYVRSN